MKFFIILNLFLISILLLATPIGKWSNSQQKIFIDFKTNGSFTWSVNGKSINGKWKLLNDKIIQTSTNGVIANYGFLVKGDNLGLQAQNGAQLYFVKVKNKNKKKLTYTNNKSLTDSQFMYLLENYQKMHPNTVYMYMTKLSKNQRMWIPIFKAWYSMIVYIVCNGTLAYQTEPERRMCANSKREYLQHLKLIQNMPSALADPWSYGKEESNKLLIHYKCKYGLIDKGSCSVYRGIQKNMNKMTNETTKTIIKGFEPLPCTKHYEEGTNVYLGCY